MMNLKTFAKAVRRSAGKNASKILGGLAITGSITAVYFAVTATPKAMILLDEKKQELLTQLQLYYKVLSRRRARCMCRLR